MESITRNLDILYTLDGRCQPASVFIAVFWSRLPLV